MERRDQIRKFLLEQISKHSKDVVRPTAEHFGISRQAVHVHLNRLVRDELVYAQGGTRNRSYTLRSTTVCLVIPLSRPIGEDIVWRNSVLPHLQDLPVNVRGICEYGFSEMFNNVLDHSGSEDVELIVCKTAIQVTIQVNDRGVGIFRKIREARGLEDDRHAILELVKGKLTTDPAKHTGEGIFFTSRMFDNFLIKSGTLLFARMPGTSDLLFDQADFVQGTQVSMQISIFSTRTAKEIFDLYVTEQDNYAFNKTHVFVSLLQAASEGLVSRSQAKRLMARLERFKEVILDFSGIAEIGPAFADEIFRVFALAHPDLLITPIKTSKNVAAMIQKARTAVPEPELPFE